MKKLTINLASPYSIYIDHDLLNQPVFIEYCKQIPQRIAIMTDSNLSHTYGQKLLNVLHGLNLSAELISFPAGEQFKTRATKNFLEDQLLQKKYGRDTCLIALGGGVVSDIVGFTAATYCRGISVIYVPTTLLAMVDASIGGKTAVNTEFGKNMIGAFNQPRAVFIDTNTLNTLPDEEFRYGLTEIIKHSLIANYDLFNLLNEHTQKTLQQNLDLLTDIIEINCHIKKTIVETDEKEQGQRQLLNFGHTIGHAVEILENYRIHHGQAVAIGILVESYLSLITGVLSKSDFVLIEKILNNYNLISRTNTFNNKLKFKEILNLDKKTLNHVPQFVLLKSIGQANIVDTKYTSPIDPEHLDKAMDWAIHYFKQ